MLCNPQESEPPEIQFRQVYISEETFQTKSVCHKILHKKCSMKFFVELREKPLANDVCLQWAQGVAVSMRNMSLYVHALIHHWYLVMMVLYQEILQTKVVFHSFSYRYTQCRVCHIFII